MCMHFTVWHAFQLVVKFDEELNEHFGHQGVLDDKLLKDVLDWTRCVNRELWPYRPPLLSTAI